MNVLLFMFAGSDTSRESHKVLLGILPDLPPTIINKVSYVPKYLINFALFLLCFLDRRSSEGGRGLGKGPTLPRMHWVSSSICYEYLYTV